MLTIFVILMLNILILAFILTNTYIKKIVTLIVLIVSIISNSGASGEFMTIATDTTIDDVSEVCDMDHIVDLHFSGEPMDIHDPHGHLQKPYSRADATHQPAASNLADRLSETRILTRDQFPGESHHWYLAFLKHKYPYQYWRCCRRDRTTGLWKFTEDAWPQIIYNRVPNNKIIQKALRDLR